MLFCLLLRACVTMPSFEGNGHSKRKIKFPNKWPPFLKRREKGPEYEEILLQNHPQFHIVKKIAYASNDWH